MRHGPTAGRIGDIFRQPEGVSRLQCRSRDDASSGWLGNARTGTSVRRQGAVRTKRQPQIADRRGRSFRLAMAATWTFTCRASFRRGHAPSSQAPLPAQQRVSRLLVQCRPAQTPAPHCGASRRPEPARPPPRTGIRRSLQELPRLVDGVHQLRVRADQKALGDREERITRRKNTAA